MAWMRRPSAEGNGGQEGKSNTLKPEALREIEEVISKIVSSLASPKKAKSTFVRYQYITGSRMSELFVENPEEFREILYRDYGQLSDEIMARIVEALAEAAQSEEKPPSIDSSEFKEYVGRLAKKLEERLEEITSEISIKHVKEEKNQGKKFKKCGNNC